MARFAMETFDSSTTADELEREQRDADARYNAALTALDRAIVGAQARALSHDDAARVGTALLEFLQQITAFVDTKDRRLAAEAASRVDTLARALEPVVELHTQVGVLQRAVEMLKRRAAEPAPSNASSSGARPVSADLPRQDDDYKYVGFEDEFRGSDREIAARLRAYAPIFAGASDVLDVGCGRGEFLAVLKEAGITAAGVDANADMAAAACARGVRAVHADALSYLDSLPDGALGGLIAAQVVEHLEPRYLMRLIDATARTLRPGSPIVLETINPACWLAFFSSYIRDLTHVRPVHPDTLQYLLRASGFDRVAVRYSAPVPDHMKMQTIDLPAEVLAAGDPTSAALSRVVHAVNANASILNNLMFTHLDYAAVGYRM